VKPINVHDAKTHFSRLLERVAGGETIVIAKSGSPVAKLTPLDSPTAAAQSRIGFLVGRLEVPDDFDRMGADEIATSFS
jgi:prevent-host-death family protein